MELFIADSETLSMKNVRDVGPYKYAHHHSTDALVWAWAGMNDYGDVWSPRWAWGNVTGVKPDPPRPEPLLEHVIDGGLIAFWNAAFDRWIWNVVMVNKYGWPYLPLEQVLCAQAQAEANNLPGALLKACNMLDTPVTKDKSGGRLINILSNGSRETWDSEKYETSEYMGHFRSYCLRDVHATRSVWNQCRPLTLYEWQDYHVSERVNDRGVMVDKAFAIEAQRYAMAETTDINNQLFELTQDSHLTVAAHLRKAAWLHEQLHPDPELQEIVRRRPAKGEEKKPPRLSCDRPTRDAVLEMIAQPEHAGRFADGQADRVVRFLELIEAGNSAAVKKYSAIAHRAINDRIYGSYSFNGAGQTGRYTARGVQVHNMINAPVDEDDRDRAIDAMEMIMDRAPPYKLRKEFGYPISRLLARLIRPTFIAPPGKALVWADWDQIEARVLPWLAKSPAADIKLDLYSDGIDVYTHTAAKIAEVKEHEVTKAIRQAYGKVPELALGFGGGVGALSAMARSYGVTLSEEQKEDVVSKWRRENPWAGSFWQLIFEAVQNAYNNPEQIQHVGRLRYVFKPYLMKGTMVCILPDDRWLVYPRFKQEQIEVKNKRGRLRERLCTTYLKGFSGGFGRVEMWHGTLAENATQAVAASMLRLALRRLDPLNMVVLHTHDEIVAETELRAIERTKQRLEHAMTELPEWATDLPLTVSTDHGPYYTK